MACVCLSTSMLTLSPSPFEPSTVTRRVSGMRYTLKVFPTTSPIVRLHPSTAMKPYPGTSESNARVIGLATCRQKISMPQVQEGRDDCVTPAGLYACASVLAEVEAAATARKVRTGRIES
eukprot:9503830-Pyramimonas_sp.AAC.2